MLNIVTNEPQGASPGLFSPNRGSRPVADERVSTRTAESHKILKTKALNFYDRLVLATLIETGKLGERQIAFYRTTDF